MSDDFVRRLASLLLISCLVVLMATVGALAMPAVRARLGFASARPASYAVGSQIDVPGSAYESAPQTLLLFARANCGTCQRLKPLFAGLAAEASRTGQWGFVMITGTTFRQDELKYARELGLDESRLARLELRRLRVRQVPTLVLVNRMGVVQQAWEGAPSPAQQDELIRLVTSLTPAR